MRDFLSLMETKQFTLEYQYFAHWEDLSPENQALLAKAEEASSRAYSPYSHFQVGACVLLSDGQMITGNNQENAAYPSGLCAERVAFFYASSQYPELTITKVAIAAKPEQHTGFIPVNPCGGCRQVMLEYETKFQQPIQLITRLGDGFAIFPNIESLMPFSFTKTSLT